MSAWINHNFFALAEFLKPQILVIAYCFVGLILGIRFAITRGYKLLLGWALLGLPLVGLHWLSSNYAFNPRVVTRADVFARGPVKYSDAPADARTLVLHEQTGDSFMEMGRCILRCIDILTSGKFDRLAFKSLARSRDFSEHTKTFQIYSIVKEPGCKSARELFETPSYIRARIQLWELTGTCVQHSEALEIEGPRIEVRLNNDAPDNPPWNVHIASVSYQNGTEAREIYRAEYGSGEVPGYVRWFGIKPNLPKSVNIYQGQWSYGTRAGMQDALTAALGLKFGHGRELPKLSDVPTELHFEYARRLFATTTYRERCDFVVNQIGSPRMLTEPYRSLVRDLAKRTGGADSEWIAWLVARDEPLGRETLATFTQLLEGNPEFPGHLANSLRFFPAEMIREMAPRLRAAANKQPNRHSRIAATGQTVIEHMIEKSGSEQPDTNEPSRPRCQ